MKFARVDDHILQGGMPIGFWPTGTQVVFSLVRCITPQRVNNHVVMAIEDNVSPGLEWLNRAVNTLKVLDESGLTVYVHCQQAQSRSVLVCAAYLMQKYGLGATGALAWMQEKQPRSNPCRAFIELLHEYEETLNYAAITSAI